jgi:branched-subunit amino acid aminotransferase/4-amino-4-deoxychorismate lyase
MVLEARLPHGAAEGLLATPDGRLLEGLITNLFVVVGALRNDPKRISAHWAQPR